jgi:hypothetical protein
MERENFFIRLVRNTKNNTGLSDGAVFQIEAAAVTTEKEFFFTHLIRNAKKRRKD